MRAVSAVEQKVLATIEPAAADLGYRIVRVRLSGLRRKRLQIMAERLSDGEMGIEDCETLSRGLSPVLDAADPVAGEYDLEVSSPGVDRPLMRLEDFQRFQGHEAKLELAIPQDGRRRFRGLIEGVDGEDVVLRLEGAEAPVRLSFRALGDARLVLTDALIAESLKLAKLREAEAASREIEEEE